MRHHAGPSLALALASALLLITAAIAFAGGWASIQPDADNVSPRAGQSFDLGFTVLQHGATPADGLDATVRFTDPGGAASEVRASGDGNGHYTAAATLDRPGHYTWIVVLTDLVADMSPVAMTVLNADGSAPAGSPTAGGDAALSSSVAALEAQVAGLEAKVSNLEAANQALAADVAAADDGMIPAVLAAATTGALAGGIVAFVLLSLAPRRRTGEPATLAPSTR
jgi:hypothetical protein